MWRGFLLTVCVLAACMPRIEKQRLDMRASIAVAYIVDPAGLGLAQTAPAALKEAIRRELEARNLSVVELPLDVVSSQRLTEARLEAVRGAAGDAPWVLLVEQRVHFFSQLDGRYRWEVATNLAAGRAAGFSAREPLEVPVILTYDHEREAEAIAAAADDVANRAGVLLDGVLAPR